MESKMLDLKPEVKPEATSLVERKIDPLPRQIHASQENPKTSVISSLQSQEELEEPLANFGWAEIENRAPLPFVQRGADRYVANQIYTNFLLADIHKVFSKEVIDCMTFQIQTMTRIEADVFNEINIEHCEKNMVGDHVFQQGDGMSYLDDILQSVKFFQAAQDAMRFNKIVNNLFGFLKIAGESEVPFVWSDSKKFVPLFYFEGQSEYLDARSINLTDKWKLAYLKLCCLIQNIRKDYYEQNPLTVVDFEDVKKLFPADTTFQLCWPKHLNKDLLRPEVNPAMLHGYSISSVPSRHYPRGANNKTFSSQQNSPLPLLSASSSKTNVSLGTTNKSNSDSFGPSQCQLAPPPIKGKKRCRTTVSSTIAKRQSLDNSPTSSQTNACPISTEEPSISLFSNVSKDLSITLIPPREVSNTHQMTNVPHMSPQTASSPGLQLPSPSVKEAVTIRPSTSPALGPQHTSYAQHFLHHTSQNQVVHAKTTPQFQSPVITEYSNVPQRPYSAPNKLPACLGMTEHLHHNLRVFLMKRARYPRRIESGLHDLVWSFMLEEKITTRELLPIIELEVKRLWAELTKDSPLMLPQQNPSDYYNQCSASTAVQNINNTNVTTPIPMTDNHYGTTIQPQEHTPRQWLDEIRHRIETVNYLDIGLPNEDTYRIRDCCIKGKRIMGISFSPIVVDEFLVNLGDFVIKCLKPEHYQQFEPPKFNRVYKLNPIQNALWQKLVSSRRVYSLEPFHEIFVLVSEIRAIDRNSIKRC